MNKKKMTVALCVLAVICVFSVLVFTGVIDINKGKEDVTNPEKYGFDVTEYCEKITSQSGMTENPLLPTSIDGVFYSASTDGEIKFYSVSSDGGFTEIKSSFSKKITAELSEQDITADVSFIEKDGKTAGYGLYTTAISGEKNSIYKYAFFSVRNIPSAMGYSSQYLLLVDTTEDDFRNENKIYEETFTLSKSGFDTSRYFSEANRYVGLDGTKRRDYAFMTDYLVDNAKGETLFISGRNYEEDYGKFDIMETGGSGNNIDNILVEKNVLKNYAKRTDNGVIYLSENEDGKVVLLNNKKDDAVKTFDCDESGIIVSGDYFYLAGSNTVYSVNDNKEYKPENEKLNGFKADMFLYGNGKVFLRGFISSVTPAIVIYDIESGECNVYANIMFKNIINPVILKDGSAVYTVVSSENGKEYFKATVLK